MTKQEFDQLFLKILDSYPKTCINCDGSGSFFDFNEMPYILKKCPHCEGTGKQK